MYKNLRQESPVYLRGFPVWRFSNDHFSVSKFDSNVSNVTRKRLDKQKQKENTSLLKRVKCGITKYFCFYDILMNVLVTIS